MNQIEQFNILIVEDNLGDYRLLQAYLQSSPNINTRHVTHLEQALGALRRRTFDVVLLDLSLPDSRGIETFQQIQAFAPDTAIVILTGLDDDVVALQAMRQGAQDYLSKNYLDEPLLVRTLHHAIERKRIESAQQESERFARSTIDALSKHIAVLDESGTIIEVNKAWRQFAQANNADLNTVGVGVNYLNVCDAATGEDASIAHKFAVGIRAVMGGQLKNFSLEYSCHAPFEQRWFNAKVTRFDSEGPLRLVISHDNITERKLAEIDLQHSEELHRLVLSSISDAVFITDEVGDFTYVCPNIAKIFGYTEQEVLALGNSRDLLGKIIYNKEDFSTTGEIRNIEHQITDKYGTSHDLLVNVKLVNIGSGSVLYTCRDVTEHKQTTTALTASQARFASVFHASPIAITITNLATQRFVDVNPYCLEQLEYFREEVVGHSALDLDIWVDPAQREELGHLLETTGHARNIEAQFRSKSGRIGDMLLSAEIIEVNDEPCVLTMAYDITERKRHQERFHAMVQHSSDLMIVLDAKSIIRYMSPAVEWILGYQPQELQDANALDLVHPEDLAPAVTQMRDTFRSQGISQTVEIRASHKDGTWRILEVTGSNLLGNPAVNGIVLNARDITERKRSEQYARESEARYQALFERSLDAVYIHDFEGNFIDANAIALQLLEYTHEETADLNFMDVLIPEDLPKAKQTLQEIEQTGYQRDFTQFVIKAKSGKTVHVETMAAVIYRDGQPWAIQGIARDITDRIRVQNMEREQRIMAEALQEMAAVLLTHAFNIDEMFDRILMQITNVLQSDYASIMLVESGRAYVVSSRGFDEPDLQTLKHFAFDIAQTANLQQMATNLEPIVIKDTRTYAGWRGNVLDASLHTRSYIGTPIQSNGQLIGFINLDSLKPHNFTSDHAHQLRVFADQIAIAINNAQLYDKVRNYSTLLEEQVTERTAQLAQEKDHVQAILDNTQDAVVIIKQTGDIERANPAFHELCCFGEKVAAGRNLSEFIPRNQRDKFFNLLDDVRVGNTQRTELELPSNEAPMTFDIMLSSLHYDNSSECRIICSMRDITSLKAAEFQLMQALDKERELNQTKSDFTSMVSHEFRTPLAVINSSVGLLTNYHDRLTPERRAQKLKTIEQQVNRLTRLMDGVLMVSRSHAVGLSFSPEPIDVVALCETIIEEAEATYGTDVNIAFAQQNAEGLYNVDENLFRHIFQNLLSNAIKYSHNGSTVQARLSFNNENLTLAVVDKGIGIPSDAQEKLFKTFHRAGNVGTVSGTGLGLAIVKRAVDEHRGTIRFNSIENEGTMFIVTLPINTITSLDDV